MLKCPSCDTVLNQDFGMVTCQNCGAVLIVEISGEVRMGGEADERQEDFVQRENKDEIPGEEEKDDGVDFQNDFFESDLTGNENQSSAEGHFEPEEDFSEEFSEEESINSGVEDVKSGELEESESGFQEDFFESDSVGVESEDFDKDPDSSEDLNERSQPNSTPVDISDFANSEESKMDDGEYLYDLVIDQLDSKEVRGILKSVLEDDKLKINVYEFLRKIKNGRLCVSNLNPVKAKIIVEQLQFYDLHIEWKQKRVVMEESISQNENNEGESQDGEFLSEDENEEFGS